MNNDKKMRVSDEEIAVLNGLFAGNDELLVAIRNVFFGMSSKEEGKLVEDVFKGKDVALKLMRKMFLPELSPEIPLGQTVDLWLTVDVKDKPDFEVTEQLVSRNMLISYIEQSLNLLNDTNLSTVDLSINPKKVEKYTKAEILARNNFIQHIEAVLLQMKVLAGMKNETPEQIKERIAKNSTK